MTKPLLGIEALRLTRGRTVLLDQFDLHIQPGECVELRGANGTGKSTLLRAIAGLHPELEGRLEVDEFAYVGHTDGLSALLTVSENLRWYAQLCGTSASQEEIKGALERLGVARLHGKMCGALSAGQRRRAALARLRIVQRPLWMLDEPYTALDEAGSKKLDALIQQHCTDGGAVLVATHADLGISSRQCWLDR